MICISCGKTIDDDSRFCEFCGAKQAAPEAPVIPPAEADLTAPVIPDAELSGDDPVKPLNEEVPDEIPAADTAVPPEPAQSSVMSAPPYGSQQNADPFIQPAGGYAPPPYNGPVYAPAPEVPEEEEAPLPPPVAVHPKLGAGKKIAAWFISLFAIIVLTVLSLAFCIKLGVTGNLVRNRIETMTPDNVLGADVNGESLSDNIYKGTDFGKLTYNKADRFSFREFMTKTDFLSFVGKEAAGYVDCIIGGSELDPSVSANEIMDFFEGNADISEDQFGYRLQTVDYNTMRRNIEKEGFIEKISLSGLSDAVGFPLQNLSYIFSYITLGILLALLLVLLIWIAVVTDRRGKYITGSYGKILTWSGIIVLTVALAVSAGAAIAYILTGWFEFYICASVLLPFAALAGITGVFEIILGTVFRRIRRTIRAKERREQAVIKALSEQN
ncbi:MAG: zinc-ribbon domain-containing protein [Ruminococcus sp.]|nr:zinc-ribbon domain-containing protein [Ruminococcus sp.]